MKKKILLTIGSLSATTLPISAIIACSPNSNMGKEESKFLESLKSSDGIRKINNLWLNKAIKEIYSKKLTDIQKDLKSYIEFFMAEEIRKNNKYLTELYKSWSIELSGSSSDRDKRDNLISKYKMGKYYDSFSAWTKELNGVTFDNFIDDYLFDGTDQLGEKHQISIKTDFLVNAKKALIVKNYLGIDKDDWMKVFGNEDDEKLYDSALDSNKSVWDLIDKKEFPLILEGMRKHYAYSWNIKIDDKDEVLKLLEQLGTGTKPGEEQAEKVAEQFEDGKELGKLSTRRDEKHKAIYEYSVLSDKTSKLWQYVGYKGITTLPQGDGSINFKWDDKDNWKDKKDPKVFNGFIEKDKLLRGADPVKYAEQSAKEINLTLYNGNYLIPTYDESATKDEDKKIKFAITADDKKENLYWTFINQNKTLYEKAVQYYTNKENPIQLDASGDKYLEKQLIDMGIKFIKKPE